MRILIVEDEVKVYERVRAMPENPQEECCRTNIVDVYINLLRKKVDRDFGQKLIQTRIGLGYTIDSE